MKQYVSDRALAEYSGVQQEQIENTLARLVNARLLRREEGEGEFLYELVHEFLITEIGTWIEPADLEIKQIAELLQRETINWRVHQLLIPKSRLEMLYAYRERLTMLDIEAWTCLLRSALVENLAFLDWVKTVSESDNLDLLKTIVEWLIVTLRDEDQDVRRLAA